MRGPVATLSQRPLRQVPPVHAAPSRNAQVPPQPSLSPPHSLLHDRTQQLPARQIPPLHAAPSRSGQNPPQPSLSPPHSLWQIAAQQSAAQPAAVSRPGSHTRSPQSGGREASRP